MIGRLRGEVAEVEADAALIDVMGVGYRVRMGSRGLARLPALGEGVTVHIESRWSEQDGPTLYGFLDRSEREVFNVLTAIQGVGPKAGLSVLDVLPPADLATAVAREDKASVGRANGVGPKLALRIVTELKGKALGGGDFQVAGSTPASAPKPQPTPSGEAVAALMGLGVTEALARRAVETAAARLPDAELPALIKAALQETAR